MRKEEFDMELEEKQKKEYEKMKRIRLLLWAAFLICLVTTVVLWFLVNKSNPEYEEVEAIVSSSETTEIVNRKNGTRTYKYEVKVRYDGHIYDLGNVHNSYSYLEGKTITAYLANGKLYANKEGVKTSTPLANAYFVFLIGSIGLLIIAPSYSAKIKQYKNEK